MPGFELFGDEERKEVNDVLETGVLFRYGFEGARNGHFKALEFEKKKRSKTFRNVLETSKKLEKNDLLGIQKWTKNH